MAAPVFASVIFPEKILVWADIFLMGSLVFNKCSEFPERSILSLKMNTVPVLEKILNYWRAAEGMKNSIRFRKINGAVILRK